MKLFGHGFASRHGGVPADVVARAGLPRGEKVLAHAVAGDGTWLLGARGLLALVPPEPTPTRTIPWERVEDAAWDQEASRLRVTEIGSYGEPRPSYSFDLEDPALLLQLVRERVTASIVLQRRVSVRGQLGLTVIGRRSPVGGPVSGPVGLGGGGRGARTGDTVTWMHAYDAGLDPDDPEVAAVAHLALLGARAEVGEPMGDPI